MVIASRRYVVTVAGQFMSAWRFLFFQFRRIFRSGGTGRVCWFGFFQPPDAFSRQASRLGGGAGGGSCPVVALARIPDKTKARIEPATTPHNALTLWAMMIRT